MHSRAKPFGGGEVMTATIHEGLRRRGHDVRLLAGAPPNPPAPEVDASFRRPTGPGALFAPVGNPFAYRALQRTLADFEPDVVHVSGSIVELSPLVLPPLRGIPALYHAQNVGLACPVGTKRLPDGRRCRFKPGRACHSQGCLSTAQWLPLIVGAGLWRRWMGVFDCVVANSQSTKRHLQSAGVDCVEVILNGTPVTPSRPRLADPPTVAFAGRFEHQKGIDVLLYAFARVLRRLPDARLLLAGAGPEHGQARELAAELGIETRVQFLGHVRRAGLDRLLEAAWVQVVPSRTDEGFGLVAAEAMMRGTAVVASAVGGLSEVVSDPSAGRLVAAADVTALAASLSEVLGDRELAERLGATGRDIALRRFTADRCVDSCVSLYDDLVRGERFALSGR